MCCTRLAANTWCKKSHLRTITQLCRAISSQLRHASTIEKNLLNSNISSTWSRNMANFVPLAAEIGSAVWGTTANLNGFCILPLFLQRRRSPEANWTLHDVWPSPGLRHYIYVFRGSCPLTEFRHVQISLCVQVLQSPILAALLHGIRTSGSAKQGMELQNFCRVQPIFGCAAIMLGIGPRSSFSYFLCQ